MRSQEFHANPNPDVRELRFRFRDSGSGFGIRISDLRIRMDISEFGIWYRNFEFRDLGSESTFYISGFGILIQDFDFWLEIRSLLYPIFITGSDYYSIVISNIFK